MRQPSRETLKLAVKMALIRSDLDLSRHSPHRATARLLSGAGVTELLDIGANTGQYAALMRSAGYHGRIHSFEPQSSAFQRLQRKSRKDLAWSSTMQAVGAATGVLTLNLSANSYSSSLKEMLPRHRDEAPGSSYIATESVAVTTIEHIVERWSLRPDLTFVKIDTQGFEGEVLEGAGPLLPHLAGVQLEMSLVPLYDGQLLFADLAEVLVTSGMELWSLQPGFTSASGRLLQCDGVFVRKDLAAAVK